MSRSTPYLGMYYSNEATDSESRPNGTEVGKRFNLSSRPSFMIAGEFLLRRLDDAERGVS